MQNAEAEEQKEKRPTIVRGRGAVGSSRIDKVFSKDYNPRLDYENYDDGSLQYYVDAIEELKNSRAGSSKEEESSSDGSRGASKKKRKKKDKKKKGKKKRKKSKD
jgi:hypothetical protein